MRVSEGVDEYQEVTIFEFLSYNQPQSSDHNLISISIYFNQIFNQIILLVKEHLFINYIPKLLYSGSFALI